MSIYRGSYSALRIVGILGACLVTAITSGGEADAYTITTAGYVCVDSEEVPPVPTAQQPQVLFPPLFAWDDISAFGTIWNPGNDGTFGFNIAFNFNYFAVASTLVAANSNGYVSFPNIGFANTQRNTPIPMNLNTDPAFLNQPTPNASAYAFWDDLNPPINSTRQLTMGVAPNRRWICQWTAVPHINGPAYVNATFQVTLFESNGGNAIRFQYLTMTGSHSTGLDATVGIENQTGAAGIQYLYGNGGPAPTLTIPGNAIVDGLAIGFYPTGSTPPWTSVPPNLPPDTGTGGGGGSPVPVDPNGDGEDDDRKHNRCTGDAGVGGAGAACLLVLAAAASLGLLRRTHA
jgi:hypothetical protein